MRIDGARIGRVSLRFDAAYCAVLGAAVAIGAVPIAEQIAFPPLAIAGIGVAVVGWAACVSWMVAMLPLRQALRLVMVANLLAATAAGFASVAAATALVVVAVLAIAVDIALFAASQAVALRTLQPRPEQT